MRGVRKTFEAENAPVRALRGVDLDISRGEFVALTGPSGCGKSTLLNLAAGLDVADEGSIFVAGEEVTGQGEDELARMRRRHIGIVFQFFNLLEGVTVLENVALAAIIAGRKRRVAETRARDLLDLLGLGDKASGRPRCPVRRPATAPCHRQGAGQRADAGARRRAHRRAGLRRRPGGHRAAAPAARGRPDHLARDARQRGGRRRRADSPHAATVASHRTGRRSAVIRIDGSGSGAMTELPAQTRPRSAEAPDSGPALPPERPAAAASMATRRVATGVLSPLAAIALTTVALRVPVPGMLSDLQRVGFGLVLVAAISAAVLARATERTPQWQVAAGTVDRRRDARVLPPGSAPDWRLAARRHGGAARWGPSSSSPCPCTWCSGCPMAA